MRRFVLALFAMHAFAGTPALADDDPELAIVIIPAECTQYRLTMGGAGSTAAWNQLLSFAACIQDASIVRIEDPATLEAQLDELADAIDPAIQLYAGAVEHGPGPIKLRGAYQIAMAFEAFLTRARSSIVAPPDLMTNAAAAAKYSALHEQLEALLPGIVESAAQGFELVDQAATADPSLAPDAVTKSMVRSARRLARMLRNAQRRGVYEQR